MNRPDRCANCGKKLWLKEVTLFYMVKIPGKRIPLCPECYVQMGSLKATRFTKVNDEWKEEEING